MPTGASGGSSMMPSWLSPRAISRRLRSMPAEVTPRISPTLRVMPEPGMWLPGGAKTVLRPARALGAPQTTLTGGPLPVSTVQARRRSALGCWVAVRISATRKGARGAPGSVTDSSSRPMAVRRSVTVSRGAVVSRWVLSQERVNFMGLRLPRRGLRGGWRGRGGRRRNGGASGCRIRRRGGGRGCRA